jgi:ribosomal-protein-alanine N-acetyltransferase
MSKDFTPPAPGLIVGEKVHIEPLSAQRPKVMAKYMTKNSDFFKKFSPTWPTDYLSESYWQRKIWASSQDWQKDSAYRFVITMNENVIGHINLTQTFRGPFQNCFLGYALDQDFQGRGLMKEAVGLIIDFAFQKLNLHRVQANTLVDNIASQKVLLANSFHEEGLAKNYLEIDGKWCDHKMYARLNESWRAEEKLTL